MNIAKKLFQSRYSSFKVIFERLATQAPVISNDKESIEVVLNNRKERFPLVWLRDNCTCEKCYHKQTISRIINWDDFDTNVAADSVEVSLRNCGDDFLCGVNLRLRIKTAY